jgi:hypothetical protein
MVEDVKGKAAAGNTRNDFKQFTKKQLSGLSEATKPNHMIRTTTKRSTAVRTTAKRSTAVSQFQKQITLQGQPLSGAPLSVNFSGQPLECSGTPLE